MGTCAGCGTEIPPSKAGRPRKWCSEKCRKAQYSGTCERCGKPTNGYAGPGLASSRCIDCFMVEHTQTERNAKLVELWEAGLPSSEIGRRLGMSSSAVCSWVDMERRKGRDLSRRFLPRGEKVTRFEYIGRRLRSGGSPAEIAVELGTSRASVRNMIYRARREGFDMLRRQGPVR